MSEDNAYEAKPETLVEPSTEDRLESGTQLAQNVEQVEAPVQQGEQIEQVPNTQANEDFFVAEEYGDSFSALMKSMEQGYDLKKKRNALEEYTNTLNTLKNAYNDRVNIAQNFNAVVEEQQRIIASESANVESCNARIRDLDSRIASKEGELSSLKSAQAQALKPLEDELARCEAIYASAKDEFKQVKAQRDSLELFDAQSQDAQGAQDSHDRIVADIDAKRESAKSAQKAAQKALDAQVKADKAEQRRISDEIKKLNSEKSAVIKESEEHQGLISSANERIAFCNHVIAHPEETEKMKQRIAENEATAAEMSTQIDQLSSVHEKSVKASSKARTVVIVAAIAVVVLIILFFIVGNR